MSYASDARYIDIRKMLMEAIIGTK